MNRANSGISGRTGSQVAGHENGDGLVSMRGVDLVFPGPNGRRVEVFNDFSLAVPGGQTLAIVGPSGCGKTSLLRLLAALCSPTAGDIAVGGMTARQARKAKLISMMFQKPVLLPWLTVRANATLPASIFEDRTTAEQAERLLSAVGLVGFEDAYPEQLSGGMQSRAALARAMSFHPRLLLLDEPFGALDDLTRAVMHEVFFDVLQDNPTTVIVVTHSIDEAIYLADRVIVLSERPASIRSEFTVPLTKPRTREMKRSAEFLELRTRIETMIFGPGRKAVQGVT